MAIEATNNPFSCEPVAVPSVDLTPYALKSNVLEKNNTNTYIPTNEFNPATKKYVDDSIIINRQLSLIPKPTGYDYVPFDVVKFNNKAFISNIDWLAMFKTKYAGFIGGGEVYVNQLTGDDSNSGTFASPFATLNAAKDANPSTVYVYNGNYEPLDFRDTSTQGNKAKIFIALGNNVTIKKIGDVVSDLSFTQSPTFASVFKTTLTTDFLVNKLFRTDVIDEYNEPESLPKRSSEADVNSNGLGWYYDSATKELFVRIGASVGANQTERETWFNDNVKPILEASYIGVSTAEKRFYFQNTKVFMQNFKIDGAYFFLNNTAATSNIPTLWCDNVELRNADTTGITAEGSETFLKDFKIVKSNGDNFGYHVEAGVECRAVEYNCISIHAGDVKTFPATSANKNASSMHENGTVLRIGGNYDYSYPYNIVDTGLSGTSTGKSWNIGCKSFNASAIDIIMYDREVIIDHVEAKTIQAADNSKIIHNDLVVDVLDTISNGELEEHQF